jgi:tRNA (pseudouridine54-N1)-methyltransferase
MCPHAAFYDVVQLEGYKAEVECGLGLERLPPHHQVVVVNINADRLLQGKPQL